MIKERNISLQPLDQAPDSARAELNKLPRDTNPVLYMGGTLHGEKENWLASELIQSRGRRIIAPLADRITKNIPWRNEVHTDNGVKSASGPGALLEAPKKQTKAIVAAVQKARAKEVIAHAESQPEKVTLIAQSADAQPAMIAAHEKPEFFGKLILVFPSGVDKKEEVFAYSKRAAKHPRGEKAPKTLVDPENNFEDPKPSSLRELGKLARRRFEGSGGWRALMSTISGYQGGLLHEMRQKEDAPAVAMVLGVNDLVAPPEQVLKSLKSADDVDFLLIVNSTHGIKGRKDLMDEILELADVMEAQSQAQEAAKARGEEFNPGSLADRLIFLDEGPYSVPEEEQERLRALADQVPEAS